MRELTIDETEVVEGGWWIPLVVSFGIGLLTEWVYDACFGSSAPASGGSYQDPYRTLTCDTGQSPVIIEATPTSFQGYCA